MNVLIISQYYPPEPVPIPEEVATGLAERGHSVRVLTGFPNYPQGTVAPGFRQRWRYREVKQAVTICRVPMFVDHSQRLIRRLANYVSFALSALTARRFAKGADVIYIYSTPMTAAVPAWLWRLTFGPPYILHVQDLWPDSVTSSSMIGNGRAARALSAALNPPLRSMYRNAAAVIGIAPTMVSMLIQRGSPRERTSLIYNWVGAQPSEDAAPRGRSDVLRVLYAGNVGEMQDLGTAIRAVHAAADVGLELVIVGNGVARSALEKLVAELGVQNVTFREPVSRAQMSEIYAEADFALIPLRDLQVFRGTIPSKFQSALSVGLPVVSTVPGDVRALVDENGLGITADPESVCSLEAALRRAAGLTVEARAQMSRNGRDFHRRHFSSEAGLSKLHSLMELAGAQDSPRMASKSPVGVRRPHLRPGPADQDRGVNDHET